MSVKFNKPSPTQGLIELHQLGFGEAFKFQEDYFIVTDENHQMSICEIAGRLFRFSPDILVRPVTLTISADE